MVDSRREGLSASVVGKRTAIERNRRSFIRDTSDEQQKTVLEPQMNADGRRFEQESDETTDGESHSMRVYSQ